jgi:penicillin-binding protein 1C
MSDVNNEQIRQPNPPASRPVRLKVRLKRVARLLILTTGAIALLVFAGWLALPLVPLPEGLFRAAQAQLEITDIHGQPLRAVRSSESAYEKPVAYGQIPPALFEATLAAEDKRFWRHPGVDARSSMRAAWDLARHRRIVSGGSTITQQLIKLHQPRGRTFRAKFWEALQALRLEQVWDKQRILAEYLNRVDYGNLNTGCAAAADYYFGKPLRELSTAECALVAALPQAPSRLNPFRHFEAAHNRQQWILERMLVNGWLTREEYQRAKLEEIRLVKPRRVFEAPHFVDLLLQSYPSNEKRDLRLRTSLDLELNRFAQDALSRQLKRLRSKQVENAAAVVIDNHRGGVLALVGSEDYFAPLAGQVNGAWAARSAGSTFKPFTYAIAFEQGATPATIVADVPAEFATATGLFSPANYDRRCRGPMRYRLALANSLNIAAVKVLESIGGPAVLQSRLQQCGLTTLTNNPEQYGLGLTIGNAEARLLELANAYACLARLGEYLPFCLTADPQTSTARVRPQRIFSREVSYLLADILSDNTARASAFGFESSLRFDFPVACKTGTSSDFRDNWAFGYTPEFTIGVWVGNFDGSPMHEVSGVTGAAPLMHELMEYVHQRFGTSWYEKPEGVIEAVVHSVTGKKLLSGARYSEGIKEKFVAAHLAPLESPEDYDPQGRIRLPSEYHDWFASGDNWLGDRAVIEAQSGALRILFPLPGTTLFLDGDLPHAGKRLHLRAEGGPNLHWDSDTLKFRESEGRTIALLEKGEHRLSVRDVTTGTTRQTWVKVLER